MLQVRQARVHRVAGADAAQAAQREVVVEDERLLGVVEALDVLARLGVVGAAVDVLHHVQVLGDVLNAQWAKSGFFVQWVYWVYLFSQNTRPLCAHCAMLQCFSRYKPP